MATREILVHEHPLLRKKAKEVKKMTPEIKALCEDLLETMRAAPGVGLAANQIGSLHRVIAIELPEEEEDPLSGKPFCLINPTLVSASDSQIANEGCLSVPGYVGEVERHGRVVVKALAENGKPVRLKAADFFARVLQHEMDHLDGILYIDKLTSPDKLYKVPEGQEEIDEIQEA
jgi:peptide deformylase